MLLFSDMLYMLVRYASPSGPMLLRLLCWFWVVLVFCWPIRVLSSKGYVCCCCDTSVCLGVPSICQLCVFV